MMTRAFGIIRLLLAVAVFASAFAFVRAGAFAAILVAIPLAGLVLVVRKRHVGAMLRAGVSSLTGVAVSFMLCPMVLPSCQACDRLRDMIAGAVAGWIIGVVFFDKQAR